MYSDDMTIWKDEVSEVYTSYIIYNHSLPFSLFLVHECRNNNQVFKASSCLPDRSIFINAELQNQLTFV